MEMVRAVVVVHLLLLRGTPVFPPAKSPPRGGGEEGDPPAVEENPRRLLERLRLVNSIRFSEKESHLRTRRSFDEIPVRPQGGIEGLLHQVPPDLVVLERVQLDRHNSSLRS